jgi:hypothetical protein
MLRLLRTCGVLMIFEEKNYLKKFLFKWNGMVMTVDILTMDAYYEMGLSKQYS